MTTLAALEGMDRLSSGDVLVAQNVAFAIMAITMVASALRMVTTRNVVHAALYLVIVLAGTFIAAPRASWPRCLPRSP